MRLVHRSLASVQLREVLQRLGLRQGAIAGDLGVTQQAVSNWLTGFSRPDPTRMALIEERFGVPMRAWTQLALPKRGRSARAHATTS